MGGFEQQSHYSKRCVELRYDCDNVEGFEKSGEIVVSLFTYSAE